jgi:hypothetical protein
MRIIVENVCSKKRIEMAVRKLSILVRPRRICSMNERNTDLRSGDEMPNSAAFVLLDSGL